MPPNNSIIREGTTTKFSKHQNSEATSTNTFIQSNHSPQDEQRLFRETFAIVQFVIYWFAGRKVDRHASSVDKKVRELTSEILVKHDVYNALCSNLGLTPENLAVNFRGVAETIFEDGFVNWGRLIALLGFSVKVAEYFRLNFGNHDQIIVEMTTHFIVNKTGVWIESKRGWGDVITHFSSSKNDAYFSPHNASWFKGILMTATATIGIGAIFAVTQCK